MVVELLYFDGYPSWRQALKNLERALQDESAAVDVSLVRVDDHSDATRRKFMGSPSIRISGEDLFPEEPREYAMSCRVYRTEEGLKGWPTAEMIRQRLQVLGASDGPRPRGDVV